MIIVNIVSGLILFFSFISGLKEGAVKSFFSLLTIIISLPISARFYYLIANLLSFLPGEDWQNFIGFLVTSAIVSMILHAIFFMPRKILQKVWSGCCLSNLLGGVISLFNAAVGLTVLALLLRAFPVWGWLEQAFIESAVINWLIVNLGFVQTLLLDISRKAAGSTPI